MWSEVNNGFSFESYVHIYIYIYIYIYMYTHTWDTVDSVHFSVVQKSVEIYNEQYQAYGSVRFILSEHYSSNKIG